MKDQCVAQAPQRNRLRRDNDRVGVVGDGDVDRIGAAVACRADPRAPDIVGFDDARTWRNLRNQLVARRRSEEHTSELQSRVDLVCRLLLEKKKDEGGLRGMSFSS